jgi:diguanylate cyclase (GGDEF)-like protein
MVRRHRRPGEGGGLRLALWWLLVFAVGSGVLTVLVGGHPGMAVLCGAAAALPAAGLCAPGLTDGERGLTLRARTGWSALALALVLLAVAGALRGLDLLVGLQLPGAGVAEAAAAIVAIAAVCVLTRDRMAEPTAAVRLDGAIVGLSVAAFTAAVVAGPLVSPPDLGASIRSMLSLLLLATVAGCLAVLGLSGGRDLRLALLGTLLTVLTWSVQFRPAPGESAAALGVLTLGGLALVAAASVYRHRPVPAVGPAEGRTALLLPGAFTVATVLLVAATLTVHVPLVTGALALSALAAALGRAGLALHQLRAMTISQGRAQVDELTGLQNRRAFLDRLATAVARAGKKGELALFVVDLDRFKVVNEALGATAGNEILRQSAERLSALLEPSVPLGRLGGDEFGIVLVGGGGDDTARDAAHLLAAVFDTPFRMGDTSIRVDVRVGVALRPVHADDATGLLRRAEVATQQARNTDGRIAVYEPSLDSRHSDGLITVDQLRSAVSRGELLVHYQPQVSLGTGDVVGVEALVRWNHPERGILRPDSFLALVEQAGLMRDLTEVVLGVAVRNCRRLWDSGRAIGVTVNLSAANLLDAGLPDLITRLLGREGLPSSALRLEATEDTFMADPARATTIFERLRAVGIAVTLDDFGGGNSSLAYLRRVPIDALKLDNALVHGVADDGGYAVVHSVVELAHALGLTLAASGVEDTATLDRLAAAGCDVAQGYYIAAPMPADELVRWLDAYRDTTGSIHDRLAVAGPARTERPDSMLARIRTGTDPVQTVA